MYDYLFAIGFDFKEARANTIKINSVPGEIGNINIPEAVREACGSVPRSNR